MEKVLDNNYYDLIVENTIGQVYNEDVTPEAEIH